MPAYNCVSFSIIYYLALVSICIIKNVYNQNGLVSQKVDEYCQLYAVQD